MKCRWCDGELVQASIEERFRTSLAIAKWALSKSKTSMVRRPRSKSKRIQKKWEKRFSRIAVFFAVPGMKNLGRTYHCNKCGKTEGLYSAVARNAFPIQQMPNGALPFYNERDLTSAEKQAIIKSALAKK